MTTPGRRIHAENFAPGDYGRVNGVWMARPPDPRIHMGDLSNHEVEEHEDGTITVSPSILVTSGDENGGVQWHGYLRRGIWEEA